MMKFIARAFANVSNVLLLSVINAHGANIMYAVKLYDTNESKFVILVM